MARTATRTLAFRMIFQADFGQHPDYPQAINDFSRPVDEKFLQSLVEGALEHSGYLDEVIDSFAHSWSVERMPRVDRAILRLGAWELLATDIPAAVAIDEAVELAKDFGGPDSSAFVNGVLDSMQKKRQELALRPGSDL